MATPSRPYFVALTVAASLLAACGDDDSGEDTGATDTPSSCMDRPGDLPRPPEGRLSCDLVPPGLSL